MKPMPAEIAARWGALWPASWHPERPWWRSETCEGPPTLLSAPSRFRMWQRAEGAQFCEPVMRAAEAAASTYALADYDREHPLPMPPPMASQVWVYPSGMRSVTVQGASIELPPMSEVAVVAVMEGRPLIVVLDAARFPAMPEMCFAPWPLVDDAVLVAGPTPWGRDVPWCPPEETP